LPVLREREPKHFKLAFLSTWGIGIWYHNQYISNKCKVKTFIIFAYQYSERFKSVQTSKVLGKKNYGKIFLDGCGIKIDDRTYRVGLFLDDDDCYMTNGRFASNYFDFQEPISLYFLPSFCTNMLFILHNQYAL
jgi:hypothetical protein